MNHIISNVKEGFSKAFNATKDKLSQVKDSISNIHVSAKRSGNVTMSTGRSRSRITMQRPAPVSYTHLTYDAAGGAYAY